MSSLLAAELAATCSALGYGDEKTNRYYADTNAIEALKDLIRYLRRDDDSHDIRRQLGETNVLGTDLLPLLKTYWERNEIFDVCLRLLINLTTPPLILWHEEQPTEKTTWNHYLQIERHLQNYKQAFADDSIWAILSTKLSKILELDYVERGEENSLIIERILILIRNVLYVPSDPDRERRPDNDANTHDQVLWALHQSGMVDIILYMSSSLAEKVYFMHILEILSFMLREQNAAELAKSALERDETEKLKDEAQLLAVRHHETNEKREKIKMYNSARHSRFGGTYVMQSVNSVSNNNLIYHKPLNKLDKLSFDAEKRKRKKPKNRMPIRDSGYERHSAFSIRLFLKEFCIEFLNGAYNVLMHNVKDSLVRAKAQAHDESYYLWAMRFFMEFNRYHKCEVKLISETASIQSFHFVQKQIQNYFDMIYMEKKKFLPWSKRLHLAVLAYRELLLTIAAMEASPDPVINGAAKAISNNIFYILEYRELVLTLLVTYNELKMSDSYLNDLLETQHIFLKMLEKFCKKSGTIVVEEKQKKRKSKKKSQPQRESVSLSVETLWEEIAPQLSPVLENPLEITVAPFDAASSVPIEEQKPEAMKNIQRKLRNHEFEEAVALLRAAREVWPENDVFGSSTISWEEEFLILQEVFFADLGVVDDEQREDPEIEEQFDENEEDEDDIPDTVENTFKFEDFSKRLATPGITRACGLCLKNFNKNSPFTNHCIIKLLHRIAVDNKMYVMIFQASIFRTFQRIYEMKALPQYKELVKFAAFILRKFFKVAKTNPKVFMELLFWKSSKDAYEIENGYGMDNKSAKNWTDLEEVELRKLFMEHRENQNELDVVDWCRDNLINHRRTRRGVLLKLKELGLLVDYKGPKKSNASKNKKWSVEEENELRELHEQFKEDDNPLTCIMTNLTQKRPKNRIIEKMLVMGLINDRSELRKKRTKKSKVPSNNFTDDESSLDAPPVGLKPTKTHPNKKARKKPKQRRTVASSAVIKKLLLNIYNQGTIEPLKWLEESFSEAADDLEGAQDVEEISIPLVPFTELAETALETKDFQDLLKALSILEPDGEQEVYWRISGNLGSDLLRNHCELISKVLEGKLVEENEIIEASGNESEVDALDAVTLKRKEAEENPQNVSLPSADIEIPSSSNGRRKQSKKKIIRSVESSDEEDTEEANVQVSVLFEDQMEVESKRNRSGSESEADQPKKRKKIVTRAISSDEEDTEKVHEETEGNLVDGNEVIEDNRVRSSGSDSEVNKRKGSEENSRVKENVSSNSESLQNGEIQNIEISNSSINKVGEPKRRQPKKKTRIVRSVESSDEDTEKIEEESEEVTSALFEEQVESKRNRSGSESEADQPKKRKKIVTRAISSDEEDTLQVKGANTNLNDLNLSQNPPISETQGPKKRNKRIVSSDEED